MNFFIQEMADFHFAHEKCSRSNMDGNDEMLLGSAYLDHFHVFYCTVFCYQEIVESGQQERNADLNGLNSIYSLKSCALFQTRGLLQTVIFKSYITTIPVTQAIVYSRSKAMTGDTWNPRRSLLHANWEFTTTSDHASIEMLRSISLHSFACISFSVDCGQISATPTTLLPNGSRPSLSKGVGTP